MRGKEKNSEEENKIEEKLMENREVERVKASARKMTVIGTEILGEKETLRENIRKIQ